MSVPKLILIGAVILFASIGIGAFSKKSSSPSKKVISKEVKVETVDPSFSLASNVSSSSIKKTLYEGSSMQSSAPLFDGDLPHIDRIFQLFTTGASKLPIVETVSYASQVAWLKGRPAWIADYAVYYGTSKHFIARGLNKGPQYFSQKVAAGDQFNVFRKDKNIEFHLVADLSRLKMLFYYVDLATRERVLLKVYSIGAGRIDEKRASGTLTPLGTYMLGDKIVVYKPGVMGVFCDQKTEMIRVFGTRWLPFELEIGECSDPAKGYGLHGAPWIFDAKKEKLVENKECIGKYESDGCIRLLLEDIEEIYAIVVTKPTFVHIVNNYRDSSLPGSEVGTPSR